ncbi:MAG: quercetin 2,3-dioxygenase [Hyphomicrobiales bacterium]
MNLARDEGERLLWMGDPTLIKVTGAETGGRYAIAEIVALSSGYVPLHVHRREDEAFFIIEGEVTFRIGDTTHEAGPGSFLFGPRGVPHSYALKTPRARMLMIFSPAGFEGFIRATSEPSDSMEPPASPPEIDFARVMALAAEYGAEILE